MVTKKQHYYPRSLLKYFADEENKVYVYIRQGKVFRKMTYEKLCASNNTYETNNIVDNILENKFSKYEAKMSGILENIINNVENGILVTSKENQDFIYKFMCLQAIRTDAGRINFMNYLKNPLVFRPRRFPLELEEIKNNEVAIDAFNRIFKVKNNLENLFHLFERPDEMDFYIALTNKNLITSDNPVTGNDDFRQFILPIHPNICIEFLDKNKYQFKEPTLFLTDNKVDFLNKTTINTANYFVISNQPFTEEEQAYITMRFKNPKSIRKPPFFESDVLI